MLAGVERRTCVGDADRGPLGVDSNLGGVEGEGFRLNVVGGEEAGGGDCCSMGIVGALKGDGSGAPPL